MTRNRLHEALLQLAMQPRSLAKSLSRQMAGGPRAGVTILSLDSQWLKLVQGEAGPRGTRITNIIACPVQGDSPEQIEARLRKAWPPATPVPRDLLIANPTHLSTIRIFSLPSTDAKEIRDIVDLQAEKHTPYARDEILTDFAVLARERKGYSRVLLAIAHQDVVRKAVRVCDSFGWSFERVGSELEGLAAWYRGLRRSGALTAPAKGAGATLLIDVDSSTVTVLALLDDQLVFQRSLGMGFEQLHGDPAQAGERLAGELQRSIEVFEAEAGATRIQDVVLTGPVDRLNEFKGQIEKTLDLPVTLVSPWTGCQAGDAVRRTLGELPEVSWSGLVGLLADPGGLDLTPQATKLRQAFEARAKALVTLGCQFIGVLILMCLLFIGRAQKAQRYHDIVRTMYETSGAGAAQVEQAVGQVQFVERQLKGRGRLLEAVETVARLLPEHAQWNTLTYTVGEALVMGGTADTLPKVYEYSGSISGAPGFGEAEVRRVSKRAVSDEESVTDFELRVPLVDGEAGS